MHHWAKENCLGCKSLLTLLIPVLLPLPQTARRFSFPTVASLPIDSEKWPHSHSQILQTISGFLSCNVTAVGCQESIACPSLPSLLLWLLVRRSQSCDMLRDTVVDDDDVHFQHTIQYHMNIMKWILMATGRLVLCFVSVDFLLPQVKLVPGEMFLCREASSLSYLPVISVG